MSSPSTLPRQFFSFLDIMLNSTLLLIILNSFIIFHFCKVEVWLNRVQDSMRSTITTQIGEGVTSYEEKPRDQWLFDFPAQVSLCGTQIWWTTEINIAFSRLEEGYDNAIRDYYKKQVAQLSTLISLLLGDLTKQDRQKIMTICTIDVHSRDVVSKLIQMKVDSGLAFQWVSQLRHRWDEKDNNCYANICDAQFRYSYEYLGNTPRLVITPLTDRCYITLTQVGTFYNLDIWDLVCIYFRISRYISSWVVVQQALQEREKQRPQKTLVELLELWFMYSTALNKWIIRYQYTLFQCN